MLTLGAQEGGGLRWLTGRVANAMAWFLPYNKDMEARAKKIETVIQDDGVILFPGVKTGDHVEVIVIPQANVVRERPPMYGWLKGKIRIGEDFDDPIPGMEDYQ